VDNVSEAGPQQLRGLTVKGASSGLVDVQHLALNVGGNNRHHILCIVNKSLVDSHTIHVAAQVP
jgi:hypothetical protein